MHWVSGNMSQEQRLVQATQTNEELRQKYRALAVVAYDAQEHLRKLREALEECLSAYGAPAGLKDSIQAVLDEHL
jgi:hypothetical protein